MFIFIYIVAIVLANMSVWYFGPAVTPINAFLLIGLDLSLRDKLHESIKTNKILYMSLIICAAGLISYLLNPATGIIAVASALSFAIANIVDTVIYQFMNKNTYLIKSNGSNIGSSLVDSFMFPLIAFGAFLPYIVFMQFLAKVIGGFIWSLLINKLIKGVK